MFALKVQINDQPPVTGGADDLGVLSAILTCAGKLGPLSTPSREDGSQDFTFRLGGLTSRAKGLVDEHLLWLQNDDLRVGDKVTIYITEVEKTDPVVRGHEAEQRENDEREYFNHCKRAYLELREKYEVED